MRAIWTIVRLLALAAAAVVTLVTVLFVSGPAGTTIDVTGALIDVLALAVIVAVLWSLWRDRSALF